MALLDIDIVIPTKEQKINQDLLRVIKGHKIVIETSSPLSLARKKGALKCDAEWVAMFDDDVTIPDDWFSTVSKHINDGVGAIATEDEDMVSPYGAYKRLLMKLGIFRGSTQTNIRNVLIRKSVFKTYDPPPLFLLEDNILKKHVESLGLKWINLPFIGVRHYGYPKYDYAESGRNAYRYQIYSTSQLLKRFISRLFLSPLTIFTGNSLSKAWFLIRSELLFTYGFLSERF